MMADFLKSQVWRCSLSKRLICAILLSLLLTGPRLLCISQPQAIRYPNARTDKVIDNYCGTSVADPYRWLGDLNSRETSDWVAAENRLASSYLRRLPGREELRRLISKRYNRVRITLPSRQAGSIYYRKRDKKPRSSFVTVNGVKLHYLDWGGKGEAILFLHSLSWTAYKYEKFAPRFADKYRVLALTRRGNGLSDKPDRGYDVRTQVEDIKQFLDALKIDRITLIGNSMPADEMTLFAGIYPERVNKLVYLTGFGWDHARFNELISADPTEMWQMNSLIDYNDFQRKVEEERKDFRPDYTKIQAPVLALYGRSKWWKKPLILYTLDEEPELIEDVKDERAKKYFLELRGNPAARRRIEEYWDRIYVPYFDEQVARFRREIKSLHSVDLNIDMVTGYEFETSPDLIDLHIRRFLAEK